MTSNNNRLAIIVGASENDVIGVDGDLPWRLSADLKRFKKLTMGHHIIMGRRTFQSIGRLLPGRMTVIVTRQPDFLVEGATIVHSIEEAVKVCAEDGCPFVIGGAEIYRLALPLATDIYLTRVHAEIKGDTILPEIDWEQWELIDQARHTRDEKNSADYSFETYQQKL